MSLRPQLNLHDSPSFDLFSRTAQQAAKAVISNYSTSFGVATRMLAPAHRHHIRNIYALVRVADEIVDGLAADAGLDDSEQRGLLESFVTATHSALRQGVSDNLIIHAFAQTARRTGITAELIDPFFASMRVDLEVADDRGHDHGDDRAELVRGFESAEHRDYVYGSAEVVGLMCLNVFLIDEHRTPDQLDRLRFGARQLGAAFQNISFLRDLADDSLRLGRSYLTSHARLTDSEKTEWVAIIRGQLGHAHSSLPLLPKDARAAVRSAAALFTALNDKIAATPVEHLYQERVRIPNALKAGLAARAIMATAAEARP